MSRNKYPEETKKLILDVSLKLFMEKGYENTSIQDIIDNLGGLSKGAIYHHFKSKEDILGAVSDKIVCDEIIILKDIINDDSLNGYEKLKKVYKVSFNSSYQEVLFSFAPDYSKSPKLLLISIQEIFTTIVPNYMEPIIRQGVEDGSIITEYPKQLAETIVLMTNIWLNPMIAKTSDEERLNKARFFQSLLKSMNVDLIDDQMIERYCKYCEIYNLNEAK